ncbi:hypothetical protein CJ195_06855 [Bacillus sp. UMB0899]|nr:hypothetical protein CJ195_06855 [Bacillus sp. UMB0899]
MNKLFMPNVKTVLLLTTEYGDQLIGGLGRHVNDLVRTGSEYNVTFIVMTLSHTGKESYISEDGIHVFRLLPWQEQSKGLSDYFMNLNFRFTQFILQDLHLNFDLIHVHDWFFSITAYQIKKVLRKPFITTFHSTEKERKQFNNGKVIDKIVKHEDQLLLHSDHIIVCSHYMENILVKRMVDQYASISVIPNGIVLENMKRLLSKDEALKRFPFITKPFLLGVGRMVKEKGFQVFVDAFSMIQHKFPALKLVLAGSGPYERELKKIVEIHGLESKVIFVGFLNEKERNTLLSKCEMLVIPSLYEPFGIVALEGMALAKPIIAFNTGGLKEILRDQRGIIVDQVSSVYLAERLHFYLENAKEMEKIACFGNQEMKEEYQWLTIIEKTISLYISVVDH